MKLWCVLFLVCWDISKRQMNDMENTSSKYRHVKFNFTARDFFFSYRRFWTRIKKHVSKKGSTICAHGNSNRLLEDLIPQNYKAVVNKEPRHCFYINFRVFVCRFRMVSNKISLRIALQLLLKKQQSIMSKSLVFKLSCGMVVYLDAVIMRKDLGF